jgi:hypothetical protein
MSATNLPTDEAKCLPTPILILDLAASAAPVTVTPAPPQVQIITPYTPVPYIGNYDLANINTFFERVDYRTPRSFFP